MVALITLIVDMFSFLTIIKKASYPQFAKYTELCNSHFRVNSSGTGGGGTKLDFDLDIFNHCSQVIYLKQGRYIEFLCVTDIYDDVINPALFIRMKAVWNDPSEDATSFIPHVTSSWQDATSSEYAQEALLHCS